MGNDKGQRPVSSLAEPVASPCLALPHPNPAVLWQILPDGAVLLDPSTEVYFGLDSVGTRVWQLLHERVESLDELCAAILREYPDAEPEAVRADVLELLEQLQLNGLLMEASVNGRDHASPDDRG